MHICPIVIWKPLHVVVWQIDYPGLWCIFWLSSLLRYHRLSFCDLTLYKNIWWYDRMREESMLSVLFFMLFPVFSGPTQLQLLFWIFFFCCVGVILVHLQQILLPRYFWSWQHGMIFVQLWEIFLPDIFGGSHWNLELQEGIRYKIFRFDSFILLVNSWWRDSNFLPINPTQ